MSEYIVTTEQLNWFLERMDEAVAIPAAIAHLRPIVRCCDCENFFESDTEFFPLDWCLYWDTFVESNDCFCSRGKKRAELCNA